MKMICPKTDKCKEKGKGGDCSQDCSHCIPHELYEACNNECVGKNNKIIEKRGCTPYDLKYHMKTILKKEK